MIDDPSVLISYTQLMVLALQSMDYNLLSMLKIYC